VPARNKGVGFYVTLSHIPRMLLGHKGFKKISLETGPQDFFAPARKALNKKHGL